MNAKRAVKTVSVNMRKTKVSFWANHSNLIVKIGALAIISIGLLSGVLK